MTELTKEQIAQGWIAYTGQSFDPLAFVQIYTPGGGWEFGMAGDFDFTQPTDDDYETDPIGAVNDFITRYRTFSPDLPSPPVSGEAVKLEWRERDLMFNGIRVGGIIADAGLFYACFMSRSVLIAPSFSAEKDAMDNVESAALAWLSPLTNEPVAATSGYMQAPMELSPIKSPHSAIELQDGVAPWMQECFGPKISADKLERGDRFLEEALELLQSGDYPRERIAALVAYVYGRPKGEPAQEVGGVMITLAAYCLAHGMNMHAAGREELARITQPEVIAKIRAKQAGKPTGSALPVASHQIVLTDKLMRDESASHTTWSEREHMAMLAVDAITGWGGTCGIIRGYIEAAAKEIDDLQTSVLAFGAPWAVQYAKDHGYPDGAIDHVHYDILKRAGARMASFTRHVRKGDLDEQS